MSLNLAIYGYDTDVGKLVLEFLEKSSLDIENLYPLSPLSGDFDAVPLKGKNYMIEGVDSFDFNKADAALLLCTKDESTRISAKVKGTSCLIIDNSKIHALDENVPVIIPGINDYVIADAKKCGTLATPLASSVMLSRTLMALHDEFGIAKANITLMEAVSEHGQAGTDALAHETTLLLNGMPIDGDIFKAQVAFNLHFAHGDVQSDGYDMHEKAIASQLERVLGRFEYGVDITSIQVPIFYGHSASVYVELEDSTSLDAFKDVLSNAQALTLNSDEFVTPVTHSLSQEKIIVTKIKRSNISKKAFNFIVLMDNTRLGEALSCVEILGILDKAR